MRKLIFAIVVLLAMALTSYGRNAYKNNKSAKNLIASFKIAQGSATGINGVFKTALFNLNGNKVSAFYNMENTDLIGFSIPISMKDLPANSLDNIKMLYGKYTAQTAMMFINKYGYFGFNSSVTRPEKPTIMLDINSKEKRIIKKNVSRT